MSQLVNAVLALVATAYLDAKYGLANDVRLGSISTSALLNYRWRAWRGRISMYNFFQDAVDARPDQVAYVYEGKSWTWKQTETDVVRFAHYLTSKGIKPGDRIAVFMGNTIAYPVIWLACMALNITPGFINNSLTGPGLIHCINVSEAQLVIYEPSLEGPLAEVVSDLTSKTLVREFICYDDGITAYGKEKPSDGSFHPSLPSSVYFGPKDLASQSTKPIGMEWRAKVEEGTPAALIFTSGTTGLPKAAYCSHGRMGTAACVWPLLNNFTKDDRIYTPMPLYHSSAAFLCVAAAWRAQSTVIIGRKFSASRYWDEVRDNDATVVQYIGEIARYLLATPPSPKDKQHRVRMAYGNGMRPDVWEKFRQRYGVRVISEFYASSEGNGALMNYNTGPFGAGAIGRFGPVASKVRPDFKLVQVDPITEDVYRDPKTGLCVECGPNESGEFVMRIKTDNPSSNFQGYAGNPEATKKKILSNVFEKGDAWFRSGDLMKKDPDGFFLFGDRMGDTFRWRSENVSTAEVSAALGEVISEANVYGVLVPNHDGRAGCAAIPVDATKDLDLKQLANHARKRLPKYAVPLFLRIVPSMDATGTVKQLKVSLRNQGVDHEKCGNDKLYWLPPSANEYKVFERSDYKAIEAGKVKL